MSKDLVCVPNRWHTLGILHGLQGQCLNNEASFYSNFRFEGSEKMSEIPTCCFKVGSCFYNCLRCVHEGEN